MLPVVFPFTHKAQVYATTKVTELRDDVVVRFFDFVRPKTLVSLDTVVFTWQGFRDKVVHAQPVVG